MSSLLTRFQCWLRELRNPENRAHRSGLSPADVQLRYDAHQSLVTYDKKLLERGRTQWQFGDWESLAKLKGETLEHHPDRATLALLAAAGHLQKGDIQAARQFASLAQDWGCSKKLISQILISGVYNSLGRAAAISGKAQSAVRNFESSIQVGAADCEVRLLTQARVHQQLTQLGLPLKALQAPTTQVKFLQPYERSKKYTNQNQQRAEIS